MEKINIIELVVMIGVVWNAALQTYWLFWSKSIHDRKHLYDDNDRYMPKDVIDRINFLEEELADAYDSMSSLARTREAGRD